MRKGIRRLAIIMMAFMGAVFLMSNWTMIVKANELNSQENNLRTTLEAYSRARGEIIAGDTAVALSQETQTGRYKYQRVYPDPDNYSHMLGWFSLVYGRGMLESTENAFLSGTDPRLAFSSLGSLLGSDQQAGGSVRLTIDPAAQEAAVRALAGRRGAVAAIDPRTGAILALAATPGYDPNSISSLNQGEDQEAWEAYQEDPAKPMLFRTIREAYAPGSTFKVVTMTAALNNGYDLSTTIPAPSVYQLPGSSATIGETDGDCRGTVNGEITLRQALVVSCNTAFAALAVELGEPALREAAEAYGIDDESWTMPLQVVPSTIGPIPGDAELAQSGIGLRDVRLTALQNALVAATVANGGVQLRPFLVAEYLDEDGTVVDRTDPVTWRRSTSPGVAADVTDAMVGVVQGGTGGNGAVPGVTVAGKTGTATKPDRPSDAWFISFAPADDPSIAVGVVVESVGSGGRNAAPISRQVMQAYFNGQEG